MCVTSTLIAWRSARGVQVDFKTYSVTQTLERLSIAFTANDKQEIQVEKFSKWELRTWENENSKRQLRGKIGHVVQIHVCRLP